MICARALAGPGGRCCANSKHTSWTTLRSAVALPDAFSQLCFSLAFWLADSVGSAWTLLLHLSTRCLAVRGEVEVPVVVSEVLDLDLLLPQPASNATPATAMTSHVDSFCINHPLSRRTLSRRLPSCALAILPSAGLLRLCCARRVRGSPARPAGAGR